MPVGLAVVELLTGAVGTDPVERGLVELLAGTVGAVPVEKGCVDLAAGMVPVENGAVPVYLALVLLPREEIGEREAGADENDGDGIGVVLFAAAGTEPDVGIEENEEDPGEVPLVGLIGEPEVGTEVNEGDPEEVPLVGVIGEPEAGAEENDGDGMEVPLVGLTGEPEAGAEENDGDGMEVPLVVAALADSGTEPLVTLGALMLLLLVGRMGVIVAFPVLGGTEVVDEFGSKGLRSKALIVISLWNGVKLDCRVLKKQLGPMMLGKYDAA